MFKNVEIHKLLLLALYYGALRYLPRGTFPVLGPIASRWRYLCCKGLFLKCGKDVRIERMAFFGSGANIEIGDYSGIGENCTIQSDIVIGKSVLMGANLYIHGRNHGYKDPSKPIREQGYMPAVKTVIEDDVWIGRDCMFTPGRTIRKGTVVATRALVTKDFPEYVVIGGNPAKQIGKRDLSV